MAKDMYEIRWHARGGQGAKTAAALVAEVALAEGKYSQGFPEYGPERMGAPIRGYTRIAERPIRIHSAVYYPDAVVVLDETLLDTVDVAENLSDDGLIIINTKQPADAVKAKLSHQGGGVYLLDASGISLEEIGRDIPNTPMIGALVKASGRVQLDTVLHDTEYKLGKKFPEKVVKGNLAAVKRGFEEVKKV
ncbi:MAG: 2-oxoacid:acceptor oxidoreductase family protein [Planctomycetota bacterium]|jgi:pyruvate ferredoxin oxidoreductase gamma subunit